MTIISHRHEFIFVKPHKVAGTSVRIALYRCCGPEDVVLGRPLRFDSAIDEDDFGIISPQNAEAVCRGDGRVYSGGMHLSPRAIRAGIDPDVWNAYFKFTVVRNPWDQLVSHYYWMFYHRWWSARWIFREKGYLRNGCRHCWMRHLFKRGRHRQAMEFGLRKGLFARHLEETSSFYFIDGDGYADYVMRFENLQQDFDEVCRRLRIPASRLPRTKNKLRPRGDYRDYYTDYSREYVGVKCRRIMDAFGYRFGDGAGRHRRAYGHRTQGRPPAT